MSDTVPEHEYKGGDIKLLSAELFDEIIDFLKKVSDSSSECISSLEAEDLIVRLQEWEAHE